MTGHQPNYLPWIGYFQKMKNADVFVITDNLQYEKKSFINRTQILGPHGIHLLTVPVHYHMGERINEVTIAENYSGAKHFATIKNFYASSPNYPIFIDEFHSVLSKKFHRLYDLNLELIFLIRRILNITTKIVFASDLNVSGSKTELLVNFCKALGADTILSGKGAKKYIQEEMFAENKIKLVYQEFQHPVYPQRSKEFVQGLSIIDFIFNCKNYLEVFHSL